MDSLKAIMVSIACMNTMLHNVINKEASSITFSTQRQELHQTFNLALPWFNTNTPA